MINTRFLVLPFLILWTSIYSQAAVGGRVFEDKNGNGRHDTNERGIPGVAVSNQIEIVTTNAEGNYTLANEGYGVIMITVPDGFSSRSFWVTYKENEPADFALIASPSPKAFTFVHASDTHISEKSVGRMEKFRSASQKESPAFAIVTGDLVKDALRVSEKDATSHYEVYKREISKFSFPVWNAAGNHEIFGIERHLSLIPKDHPLYGRKMYRHYFGPDYYSFNYGGIHFIALNDVDFEDLWYFGRIDSVQMTWLKQDIARVDKSTPIVTFHHMPFYSPGATLEPFEETGPARSLERQDGQLHYRHVVSNAMEVMALLKDHNYVLSLAGHFHQRMVSRFEVTGKSIRFEQAASIIEGFDLGPWRVPAGITVYTVNNGMIDEGRFVAID